MAIDALNRRLRTAAPRKRVERLSLSEADYHLFEAIERHGPLPSHYLYEFTRHLRRDRSHLQNRLTEFYHGDALGPLLIRPPQQFAGFQARYQHVVYDLAPRARLLLSERGLLQSATCGRADPFLHQLMQACVCASLELTAPSRGLRYISRTEILSHPKCPQKTKAADNPLAIPVASMGHKMLIPDELFGFEYPGAGFRFFALEIDRNTESIERKNIGQNAFGTKINGYLDIFRNQTYRTHWGVPNLHVLTVTTNATHARNICGYVERQTAQNFDDRFAFSCEPSFGANWRVPPDVLQKLLSEPWITLTGLKDIGVA